jgi:hypothetical protein
MEKHLLAVPNRGTGCTVVFTLAPPYAIFHKILSNI